MKIPLNKEQLAKVAQAMRQKGGSLRHIARTLGLHRSTIAKLLEKSNQPESSPEAKQRTSPSKLDPFAKRIEELSEKDKLTCRKIFQTLCQEGYTGGRTILADRVRSLRGSRGMRKAFARYEPAPGIEGQCDWSPYTVKIDTRPVKIHLFSLILSYSRHQYMEAFTDEKQDTLFAGHVEAFESFQGVPSVILYDNQSPVVSGRLPSGLALLHSRFEAFASHYGFQPKICLPGDPERKGRVERPFGYFETNFLPLRQFSTFKDLRRQLQAWLNGEENQPTGNFRIHSTTRRRPVDMWQQEERELLIPLPPTHFLPTRVEQRLVGKDCLICVHGNSFTVPPAYVGRQVTVLTSPKAIKVYNPNGELIAEHEIPAGKGVMVIDQSHYAQIKRCRQYVPSDQLEVFFLSAFPHHKPFLEGLKIRMKSICPIHLQNLRSLLDHFTLQQVNEALEMATGHGIFTVTYIEEILSRRYPDQTGLRRFDENSQKPKGLNLGPVDPGDSQGYDDIFRTNEQKPE
jgi:transposase